MTKRVRNGSFRIEGEIGGQFSEGELRYLSGLHVPVSSNEYERVQALRESKALNIDDMDEKFVRLVNLAAKAFKVRETNL